jgi:hypothetical protein
MPAVETRLLKTARLARGEPLAEVSELALLYDPEVDAYCLQLLSAPVEPPLALVEYWFGNLEQTERQAVVVFGARFTGWSDGRGWAASEFAKPEALTVRCRERLLNYLGPSPDGLQLQMTCSVWTVPVGHPMTRCCYYESAGWSALCQIGPSNRISIFFLQICPASGWILGTLNSRPTERRRSYSRQEIGLSFWCLPMLNFLAIANSPGSGTSNNCPRATQRNFLAQVLIHLPRAYSVHIL